MTQIHVVRASNLLNYAFMGTADCLEEHTGCTLTMKTVFS
jgi:hypothetical protein